MGHFLDVHMGDLGFIFNFFLNGGYCTKKTFIDDERPGFSELVELYMSH